MNRVKLEAKLIKIKRTQAVDLKAAADLDKRAAKKRANAEGLQRDAERIERELKKVKA